MLVTRHAGRAMVGCCAFLAGSLPCKVQNRQSERLAAEYLGGGKMHHPFAATPRMQLPIGKQLPTDGGDKTAAFCPTKT
jgi:hypothetical protein